jgi:hypothetical protein
MLNIPSEEAVEITETRAPNTLHPLTERVMALLKKDSNTHQAKDCRGERARTAELAKSRAPLAR